MKSPPKEVVSAWSRLVDAHRHAKGLWTNSVGARRVVHGTELREASP